MADEKLKLCIKCSQLKELEKFAKNRKCTTWNGRGNVCYDCFNTRQRSKLEEDRQYFSKRTREWRAKVRKEVLDAYGHKCACCGESEEKFLALDHVVPCGSKGRGHTHASYLDARRRGFPLDYQLLCHNCNLAKGFYGVCPHQERS